MKLAIIAMILLSGCASHPRTEPPPAIEASCPSPMIFHREPLNGGWQAIYETCRRQVLAVKRWY